MAHLYSLKSKSAIINICTLCSHPPLPPLPSIKKKKKKKLDLDSLSICKKNTERSWKIIQNRKKWAECWGRCVWSERVGGIIFLGGGEGGRG